LKIKQKQDKYILELSHQELVLIGSTSSERADLDTINDQLFDKYIFKSRKQLFKKYAKIFNKIFKKLNKVQLF